MKKQIVEINGKYAARHSDDGDNWFYIDANNPHGYECWTTIHNAIRYCLVDTVEDAEVLIDEYFVDASVVKEIE